MTDMLILAAFSFFNTIRVFSYLPQIVRIFRDTGGAATVSYLTWSLWFCANLSTAAYAGVIIGDYALCLVSSVNTLCCGIVICLTAYKRRHFRAGAVASAASWLSHRPDCLYRATEAHRIFPHFLPHIGPPPGKPCTPILEYAATIQVL
jgi:hypothetical protein